MKALTVMQPWAWAIFNGKNIENRTAHWNYRGPLAIHAGIRKSDRGMRDPRVLDAVAGSSIDSRDRWTSLQSDLSCALEFGAIIGVVELVDCHPDGNCCRPWGESDYVEHGGRQRSNIFHLVLEHPRLLADPIACRGALGLWTPPREVVEVLQAVS
ncbi:MULTISPECIES: ASCH domain-containing protein [Mycolicibacter]|uniref:ASCH domain-containing protein n=2 Tax=Mycolicibacter TaxID=1073531 RepID=A0ABU5XL69_9MYCO|nr:MULTISPECIES: hypothetical protein [unclassified Mycolicibacter]MEB3023025.1 hypothetical protein [Mycolicibacter sp. MYC098]MEB3033535.1 hypothetical protein [Mycolicibacter sp. MYC340]